MADETSSLPGSAMPVLRIIDANLNRAAEGSRVVEEFCRFVLDDAHLTGCWKQVRHEIGAVHHSLTASGLLAARDTPGDVGTAVKTSHEERRETPLDVARASCKRVQQALRSLAEYAKVLGWPSERLEALRYRAYTLEKATLLTSSSCERLAGSRLYVLMDGGESADAFAGQAVQICRAGAQIVQLRDKRLSDRELLERARLLRGITHQCRPEIPAGEAAWPLFIMNDRPDLAVLSQADGVHVGQEELSVSDVLRIVGSEMLVGVSTHTIEQARQAVLDGANYIGCGPTFPSQTKPFSDFPGLALLRQVASEISLPAFAIGGITLERLKDVQSTGITRVAVSAAITKAVNPADAIRQLLREL